MARLFDLGRYLFFLLDDDLLLGLFRLDICRQAAHLDKAFRLLRHGAAEDRVVLRAKRLVGFERDGQPEPGLKLDQVGALVVEHIERGRSRRAHGDVTARILEQELFDRPHHHQRHRRVGAHMAGAAAMRAGLHRRFQHAGADALARHLHQPEMRDASDLDAGAIVLEVILQPLLDGAVVPVLLHVDEVDDDEAGKVTQPQLPGDFLGGLQIGVERGVLDRMLLGGAAGVDVDRHQSLGLVDDDIAAALQRHLRLQHAIELGLDAVAHEDRRGVPVGLHHLGMARHQHAHEILGLAIAVLAGDQDLVDVLVVEVTHRTLDQAAFLINQGRGRGLQRQVADVFPKPHQIFVVALDLGLGAAFAGGAQDDAHALRHLEVGHDLLQPLAVLGVGDLARDAAATRGVGHQHRVTAGERKVSGQRRALVAALFLDDLDQQDLAALDDLLDLVLAAHRLASVADLFQRIFGADRFDLVLVRMRGLHLFKHAAIIVAGGGFRLRRRFGNHIRFDTGGNRCGARSGRPVILVLDGLVLGGAAVGFSSLIGRLAGCVRRGFDGLRDCFGVLRRGINRLTGFA